MQTLEYSIYTSTACTTAEASEIDFFTEHQEIEAESMGWIPLDDGAYLHVGSEDGVVEIVGLAEAGMAGANVLWIP